MGALSLEFRVGPPRGLLYAGYLVIVAETLGELEKRLKKRKEGFEDEAQLKVNFGKIKVICSRYDTPKTKIKSEELPCAVCSAGVGVNSILCRSCKKWVHKKCSGLKGRLSGIQNFTYKSC